jgi:hypothetical protein
MKCIFGLRNIFNTYDVGELAVLCFTHIDYSALNVVGLAYRFIIERVYASINSATTRRPDHLKISGEPTHET